MYPWKKPPSLRWANYYCFTRTGFFLSFSFVSFVPQPGYAASVNDDASGRHVVQHDPDNWVGFHFFPIFLAKVIRIWTKVSRNVFVVAKCRPRIVRGQEYTYVIVGTGARSLYQGMLVQLGQVVFVFTVKIYLPGENILNYRITRNDFDSNDVISDVVLPRSIRIK